MRRIQYKTEEERSQIIKEKAENEYLIREENIIEGSYLTFDSQPLKTTGEILANYINENTSLKAENEILLQTIAEKEEIIQQKAIEVEEIKSMAGMVPDPEAK